MERRRAWTVFAATAALLTALAACAPGRAAFEVPTPPTPVSGRACAPVPTAPAPDRALTLEEAIALSWERNPDLGMARARIQQACAELQGARAQRNPYITADASVLAGDAPSMYFMKRIDARILDPMTDFNDPGAFWNLELGATLRHNLWDGGRTRLGIYSAETGVGMARSQRELVANQLAAAVAAFFLQARAAEELLTADDASVKTVQSQVDDTRKKVKRGGALRSDQLSLEVRLAQAEERRIRTDVARRSALASLRRLLALPPTATLHLAPGGALGDGLPASRETALVEAYRRRPEVKMARQAVKRGRIEVERARRGNRPSVDLQARWYGDDEGLELSSNWWVAVAVTVDVWDGGRTKANTAYARAVLHQLEERDRKALLDIAHDVETTWLGLEEARARLAVATQAVGAADETLGLVEKQYRAGAATITRFLSAEADRTRARTSRIRADLALAHASVEARRAIGQLGREIGR